jgi:peptidoglycan/LPS O-acetylase OafA/YrhL
MISPSITRANENIQTVSVTNKKHIPVLDGIRAIAVLLVISFHYWQGFSSGGASIEKLAIWGQTGVDLFFVLSGFLITGILLDSKCSENFLRNFYVRRILRIFPLYYITLFAFYVVGPLRHLYSWVPWKQSIWYWVYLQNIPMTFAPALAFGPRHFWSLAVEEHYYLIWPFVVMFFAREKLIGVICLAIAISLATRIALPHYETFFFTLARLDGLAIGSALAVIARNRAGGLTRVVPWAKWLVYFVGPGLIFIQLLLHGKGVYVIEIVKSTLIALMYAGATVLAIEGELPKIVEGPLAGRFLGSIGKVSYGMYVLHPFILMELHEARLGYGLIGLVVSIILTYLAAWVSWLLIEKRFLQLKRYFEYGNSRHTQPLGSTVAV